MNAIELAYEQFCRQRFPLPNEADVVEVEIRMDTPFPLDYREYLLQFNGGLFTEPQIVPSVEGCPVDRLRYLNGIRATVPVAELATPADLVLFDDNDPVLVLPIGNTLMGGLIVLMTHPEDEGAIMYKKAFGDFYFLADNIESFFQRLRTPIDD